MSAAVITVMFSAIFEGGRGARATAETVSGDSAESPSADAGSSAANAGATLPSRHASSAKSRNRQNRSFRKTPWK
jgi:hypothetical protein